jgi:hypothetical protein
MHPMNASHIRIDFVAFILYSKSEWVNQINFDLAEERNAGKA